MSLADSSISTPPDGAAQREVRIPMDDGAELAATLYLPAPELGPQPCLIEALPYRKDDITSSYAPEYVRLRDEYRYAVCRIDLRGTGSSSGDATDEYPAREQRDLATAMTWLAGQDWCDGNLGMYGTSYSGFNSLQMACERPPELKAIVAIYATDDRYTDDVHYRGGLLKFLDLVDYCHYMTPLNVLPPVPALWGDGWREEWLRRVETNEPWLLTWLREQRGGPYWQHGSVRPDYDRIACPTMIIAGWADGYRNNSFRLVERLRSNGVPHQLLAGPWAHAATENSLPGPRIDSLPSMAAWWDRWLRGVENGVDDGLDRDGVATPSTHLFIRSSTRPEPDLDTSEGRWVREVWPSPRTSSRRIPLDARDPYRVAPAVGTAAWIDCAGHLPYGQSADLRFDDAASLTWDVDADEVTVVGHPVARLRVSADQPVATVAAKLCDVFADGTSALVSRGTLNLTHRDGHLDPQPLVPGQVYDVDVELDACAYAYAPGQRLRLSVAGADWPNTAAPPAPVTLTVHGGELVLPVWTGEPDWPPPEFAPPPAKADDDAGEAKADDEGSHLAWEVQRDVLGRVTRCVVDNGSTYPTPYDATTTERYQGVVTVDERSFRQTAHAESSLAIRWPTADVATHAVLDLVAGTDAYDVTITLEARESGEVVATRRWEERIARDLA